MGKFDNFKTINLNNQCKRLLHEWMAVDDLCKHNKRISYIVRRKNFLGLPVAYEIIYHIQSIIGVEPPQQMQVSINGITAVKELRRPIYGSEHKMRIQLPNNYPSARGNPQLFFITDIWHPNIRSAGKFKGRVCANEKDLGVATNLVTRILRVGQYLQYQLYHALDEYPYPEDNQVAEWVREEAEPVGWVNRALGIFTDDGNLKEKDKNRSKTLTIPANKYLKASGKNTLKI